MRADKRQTFIQRLLADDREKERHAKCNSAKALADVYIVKILERQTSPKKPMTQARIIEILSDRYEITIGRAAVGRIIHSLAESPLGICYNRKGVWYDETLDFEEEAC